MASEIKIAFEIDGIQKEVSSVEELQQELNKAAKSADDYAKATDDAADATADLGKEAKKTDKEAGFLSEKFNGIKDTFGKLKADAKGVAGGFVKFAKGLGLSSKAAKGLAVGLSALGIPLLLAAIAALIDYFKNFEGAAILVEKALSVAGAVIRKVTEAVMALMRGDFSGVKEALSGIGDAASEAAKGVDELFASQRALEKLQKQQVIENAKLRQSIEAQKKVLEDTTLSFEQRMAALKEVNKDTEQLAKNEIALTEATLRNLQAQLALEKNYEERIRLEQEIAQTQADLINSQTELQNIQYDAAKVERELRQQRRDEQKAAYERQIEIAEQFQSQLTALEQSSELARIADADARAKRKLELDKENAIAALDDTEFNETQKRELIKAINEQYDLDEQARLDAIAEREAAEAAKKVEEAEKKAEADAALAEANAQKLREILQQADLDSIEDAAFKAQEELRIQEEKALAELELLGATEEQKQQIENLYTKKREDLAKQEADYKKALKKAEVDAALNAGQSILDGIVSIVGEGSAVGKAAAIASTTIDTYKSATAAYSSTVGIPVVGPVLAPIAAGVAVAAGIANVKKILSVKTPGKSGGGGAGGGGGTPRPSASVSAPAFDPTAALDAAAEGQTGAPTATVEQTGSQATAPIKAYVVATEVTSEQEANKKIEDLSKL